MAERTLEEALVHAERLRKFCNDYPEIAPPADPRMVILADEVLRLQKENAGLKSGEFNSAITVSEPYCQHFELTGEPCELEACRVGK